MTLAQADGPIAVSCRFDNRLLVVTSGSRNFSIEKTVSMGSSFQRKMKMSKNANEIDCIDHGGKPLVAARPMKYQTFRDICCRFVKQA